MKTARFLFLLSAILMARATLHPSVALASSRVMVFGDTGGTICALNDAAGVVDYYIVHVYTSAATSVSFAAPLPDCHTGTWIGDVPVFAGTVGDSQSGVTVNYGECLSHPIHVLTIQVLALGTTPPCCCYPVLPKPGSTSGYVETTDCDGITKTAPYEFGHPINETTYCVCECTPTPLPTEPATWGRIKALYHHN